MKHTLYIAFLFIVISNTFAYSQIAADSIFAIRADGNLAIKYISNTGANIIVPLNKQNYFTDKPSDIDSKDFHELFYRVGVKDNIGLIDAYSMVPGKPMPVGYETIMNWNKLTSTTVHVNQVLMIGWVKISSSEITGGLSSLQNSNDHQMCIKLTGDKLHIQDQLKQPNLKSQQNIELTKKLEKINQDIKECSNLSNYFILLRDDDKKEYNDIVSKSDKVNGMTYKEKVNLIIRLAQLNDNQNLLLLITKDNK